MKRFREPLWLALKNAVNMRDLKGRWIRVGQFKLNDFRHNEQTYNFYWSSDENKGTFRNAEPGYAVRGEKWNWNMHTNIFFETKYDDLNDSYRIISIDGQMMD